METVETLKETPNDSKQEVPTNNNNKMEFDFDKPRLQKLFIARLRLNDHNECKQLFQQLGTVNFGNSYCTTDPTTGTADVSGKKQYYYLDDTEYDVYFINGSKFYINMPTYRIDNNNDSNSGKEKSPAKTHTSNPLIAMSYEGNLEAVKFLVENLNADIEYLSCNNTTAIMYAFQCGHTDVVAYLLMKGAKTEVKTLTRCIKMTDFAEPKKILSYMNLINYLLEQRK